MDLFRQGVQSLGLQLDKNQYMQFELFLQQIKLFNPTYKLVKADADELIVKHLLDSLAAVPTFLLKAHELQWEHPIVCDIGSGAGFPGIPLAIALKQFRFELVERSSRRCGFLRIVCAVCNLSDRVEIVEKDLIEINSTFHFVTFRALHPLVDIIRDIGNITTNDSLIVAYKGRLDAIEEELREVNSLTAIGKSGSESGWDIGIVPVTVPFLGAPRHLCLLKKH